MDVKTNWKHAAAAGCAIVLTVVGAGAAWAQWSAGGTGQAAATSAGVAPLTTVAVTAPGSPLYPGATGDLIINVNNPNPYPVLIETIHKNGAITTDAAHSATCPAPTNVVFPAVTLNGSWPVAANGATQITVTGAIGLKPTAGNGCSGAKFSVPVILFGRSST